MKITEKEVVNDRYMVVYQHPDTAGIYLHREDYIDDPGHLEKAVIDLEEINVLFDLTLLPDDYEPKEEK